jgi:hypothetical protein
MNNIIKYDKFLNEGLYFTDKDLFDELLTSNMPLSAIKELKATLIKKQPVTEGLWDNIKYKFDQWLSKQAIRYLIESTEKHLDTKIKVINVFDPTDFSDIKKCEIIYLGGGIDAATNIEQNWRYWFEDQFSEAEPNPHVMYQDEAVELSLSGKLSQKTKDKYAKPILFNPLRNEVIRDNTDFKDAYKAFKGGEFDEPFNKDSEKFNKLQKYFNTNVVAFDLRAFNVCDTNFVHWDATAGAGTKGELQLSMNRKQNIFMWVDSDMFDNEKIRLKTKNISPWTIGSVTKIVRGDQEVKLLIDTIKKFNK